MDESNLVNQYSGYAKAAYAMRDAALAENRRLKFLIAAKDAKLAYFYKQLKTKPKTKTGTASGWESKGGEWIRK